VVDLHRRFTKKQHSPQEEYRLSKWYTLGWGVFCIIVAMFTYNIGNSLIEAVNILGSLFYGVILGVFLIAFFFKQIKNSNAVFWGALLAQLLVLIVFILTKLNPPVFKMGFLWLNPIGALGVIFFTLLLNKLFGKKGTTLVMK
jgi:Na+/proline symporter